MRRASAMARVVIRGSRLLLYESPGRRSPPLQRRVQQTKNATRPAGVRGWHGANSATHRRRTRLIPRSRLVWRRFAKTRGRAGAATAAYFACYAKLVRIGFPSCISTYCETWGDAQELAAFLDLQSSSIETIDLDITRLMQYERRPRQSSPHLVLRAALINTCLPPSQTHSQRNYHRADGKVSPNLSSHVPPTRTQLAVDAWRSARRNPTTMHPKTAEPASSS